MTLNSFAFIAFFLPVLALYFSVFRKSAKMQNWLLLVASYLFYGLANWKALPILIVATVVVYFFGLQIWRYRENRSKAASTYSAIGICLSVALLFYCKYLNFFVGSFEDLFRAMGFQVSHHTFKVLVPLGISFFTFKLISYLIEIHVGRMNAEKDFVKFATYISFFPTILSGPIDRPQEFMEQISSKRGFSFADVSEGCKRIIWGMFEKICVADNISAYTDAIFNNYVHHNATTLLVAAVLYTLQLYTDFCGYSDMAIGVGRIMGIRVMENFRRPFFAVNIQEYWKRWHMTLTGWLTDYVFTPLNIKFRDMGTIGLYLAIVLNFILVGLWHGANWTFVVFGLYHSACLVVDNLTAKRRKRFEKKHSLKDNIPYRYARILKTFIFIMLGNLIFRSASIGDFFGYLSQFGTGFGSLFKGYLAIYGLIFAAVVIFRDWKEEEGLNIHFLHSSSKVMKVASFSLLLVAIAYFGSLNGSSFIYFQF